MPPKSQKSTQSDAEAEQGDVRGSLPGEAPAAENTATTEGDGVNIVPGPTGTVADPNDERLGTVAVKVNSNVTIGNEFHAVDPDKTVEVPNTAETQAAIAAGHLTLADDDE